MGDDFDYRAWIESNAPASCDEHDQPRVGWCDTRGFYGFAYRCGCAWGSDDGRGEGWSRYVTTDHRDLSELPPCADCGAERSGVTNGCVSCPEWACGTRYACPDCGPLNGHRYVSDDCRRRRTMRGNGTMPPSGIGDMIADRAFRVVQSHQEGPVTVIDRIARACRMCCRDEGDDVGVIIEGVCGDCRRAWG